MPAGRPKDVTLRLQVDGETARNVTEGSGGGGGNLVPWGARDLEEARVRVGCRYCGVKIVSGGKMGDKIGVKEWRDLPSESWAEMMEFWHCHKPDSGDHGDDLRKNGDVQEKGYAASNAIRAVEGVGLVDMSSFLLHDKDVLSIREVSGNKFFFVSIHHIHLLNLLQRAARKRPAPPSPFSNSHQWGRGAEVRMASSLIQPPKRNQEKENAMF